ncbi:hypothetical protein Tco_0864121 [Tanacetum coccineum]
MELHDVSYGIEYVARPFLLFFSSENRLLYFRYRESDLAHLKLVFEFSIYNVWKSVEYGVSNELDTSLLEEAYLVFLDTAYGLSRCGSLVSAGTDTPSLLDGYGLLVFRIVNFKSSH